MSATLNVSGKTLQPLHSWEILSIVGLVEPLDIGKIQNNVFPATDTYIGDPYRSLYYGPYGYTRQTAVLGAVDKKHGFTALKHGLALYNVGITGSVGAYITNDAYVEITYETANVIAKSVTPASGWINRNAPNTFSWVGGSQGYMVDTPGQTSAKFRWRVGSSGNINEIQVGTTPSVTVPAGTFPSNSEIQWQVVITSEEGVTTPAIAWYTLTTADGVPSAEATAPSSQFVNGSDNVRFEWRYANTVGSPQRAYELQCKAEGAGWVTVSSGQTQNTYVDIPGSTLPSGTVTWRVRTYNSDNVVSVWSNELTFVVIAAPLEPSFRVDIASPRPAFSWQSGEQSAYQLAIDDVYDSGTVFGTAKDFTYPEILTDGRYTARLRVMNNFNLWSEWSEQLFDVINAPGADVLLLTIQAGYDAHLMWTVADNSGAYWIYRDGVKITETTETSFVDRLSIGSHAYFIRAVLSDNNNYTQSNTEAVTLHTEYPILTALDGDWIPMPYAVAPTMSRNVNVSRTIAMQTFSGTVYPVPEDSGKMQRVYNINPAFTDASAIAAFEGLLGKIVCMKDQHNQIVVGVITSYTKSINEFYTTFSANIEEVDRSVYR